MSDSVKPFSPADVREARRNGIPDAVIEVFNRVLVQELGDDGDAVISQSRVVAEIIEATGVDRPDIFSRNWLDIEDLFRGQGWNVTYEKDIGGDRSYWTFTATR